MKNKIYIKIKDILVNSVKCRRSEFIFLLLFSLVFFVYGVNEFEESSFNFYQNLFGPSLMVACGYGYFDVGVYSDIVSRFLARDIDFISCIDVPDVQGELNAVQYASRYLMTVVGYYWSFTGISWSALVPFFMTFYLLTLIAGYCMLRVFIPVIPAALSVSLLLPIFNEYILFFRDFSKVLFIYIFFLGLMYLIINGEKNENKILNGYVISAVCGAVLGLGYGFRSDLIIFIPFFIVSMVFIKSKSNIKAILLVLLFLMAFILFSYPIIDGAGSGSNLPHVFLLGRTASFSDFLGVSRVLYDIGYPYSDDYILNLVNFFHFWNESSFDILKIDTLQYDKIATLFSKEILFLMPADFIIQFTGSIFGVMSSWWPFFLISFLSLALRKTKFFFFSVFCFSFLAGYPFIQFSERHYFYLYILYGVVLYGTIEATYCFLLTIRSRTINWVYIFRLNIAPAIFSVFGLISFYLIVLLSANFWQNHQFEKLLNIYEKAETTSSGIERVEEGGWIFYNLLPISEMAKQGAYLSIKFNSTCNQDLIRIRMGNSYPVDNGVIRTFDIVPSIHKALYFPAIPMVGANRFKDSIFTVIMDKDAESCIESFSKFSKFDGFKVPLAWLVKYEHNNFSQKIKAIDFFKKEPVNQVNILTNINELNCALRTQFCGILENLELVPVTDFTSTAEGVRIEKDVLLVDNDDGRLKNLAVLGKHEVIHDSEYVVIEGTIFEGEALIGIIDDLYSWHTRITINQKGDFRVFLPVQKGSYTLLLENAYAYTSLQITRVGWSKVPH